MKYNTLKVWTLSALTAMAMLGCNDTSDNPYNSGTVDASPDAKVTCQSAGLNILTGLQTSNVTVSSNEVIGIDGEVSFASGTTLRIDPGATVVGCTGQSYIAIDQGATINAIGTAVDPITMTSLQDYNGENSGDEQGQWGGLAVFGYAETNKGLQTYEAGAHVFGCDLGGTPGGASNGGTVLCQPNDNSGTLEYVIIKHSGFEVEKDKELNGLSLGGVGSGTTVNQVAVIGSLDDGVEVWGGTVDMTNIFLYNNADDSLDWDNGWVGSVTNIYVEQNKVDSDGSRGFETDNNGGTDAKEKSLPISNPTVTNFSIITTALGGQGVLHREGTAGQLSNGIIITKNTGKATIEIRSTNTLTNGLAYSGDIVLAQSSAKYYSGKADNPADKILGTTTDAQVETLVKTGTTVIEEIITDYATIQAGNPTVGNQTDFTWVFI